MSDRRWSFEVPSDSTSDVYTVIWELRDDGEVYATCTCPAGQKGRWCKHRRRTIGQIPLDITSTGLGRLLADLEACDAKYDEILSGIRAEKREERNGIAMRLHQFLPPPAA